MNNKQTQTKAWKTQSLHINFLFGGTFFRALIALGLILFSIELFARTSYVREAIPLESMGMNHQHFDIKWTQLRRYAEEHGGVDIIILGSSEVNVGIVPDNLIDEIFDLTGQSPRIFNFGVEGFTVNINALIIGSLIENYHPKMIIIGTEIRDYSAKTAIGTSAIISTRPWILYKNGDFNLEGWFTENSQAFRYFLTYRNWTNYNFPNHLENTISRLLNLSENGYEPDNHISEDYLEHPDPDNADDQVKFEAYAEYEVDADRLSSLASILSSGTQIVIAEMPIYPTMYDYFGNGYYDYETFVSTVSEYTVSSGNFFIPSISVEEIPSRGWSNRTHLNKRGAPVFSSYLGERLAEIIITEGLSIDSNLLEGDS